MAGGLGRTAPSGIPPEERLASLDILRGVALFGVMAVNLVNEFRVSIFQQFLNLDRPLAAADRFAEDFVALALELKALALFSLLFGAGLAMQFDRLQDGGRPFYRLARRLAALLLLGLVHLLFVWNGDILTHYALAGFLVLPFVRAPMWALAVGCLSMFVLYLAMPLLHAPVPWPSAATLQQHVTEANRVYASGSLAEIWHFSLREIPLLGSLHAYISLRTIALFLLGMLVWRSGLLLQLGRHKRVLVLVACAGIAIGAALMLGFKARIASVILALGYGAALLLLVQIPVAARALGAFAPIGRMAFTNYVMQSLVFGFIFFGWGLGQFGRLGAAHALALGIAVYAAQMLLSAWWLHRFRFGPLEWLWRSMMYGSAQPMRV